MFHIDITLEDNRMIVSDAHKVAERKALDAAIAHNRGDYSFEQAESADLKGTLTDMHTGKSIDIEISRNDLAAVCALGIHNDGQPLDMEVTNRFYAQLSDWLSKHSLGFGEENSLLSPIP